MLGNFFRSSTGEARRVNKNSSFVLRLIIIIIIIIIILKKTMKSIVLPQAESKSSVRNVLDSLGFHLRQHSQFLNLILCAKSKGGRN
jgi:hypothetical protein